MTRRRPGYALIELLIVITLTGVLLTLCAGMIHLLLKLDRSGRTASEEAADLARLARDFRRDAHASAKVDAGAPSADRMALTLIDGQVVVYEVRPRDILRTVQQGEKTRHETYRRPARTSIRLATDREGRSPFASLTINRPTDGRDDSSYQDLRVEAELGKDHRLNPRPE